MHKIFVYGSLRRGGALNEVLRTSEFLGSFQTNKEFNLYSLGAFPAMSPNGDTVIQGEVYEVDDRILAALDRIEGHPSFYTRTPITLADGTDVEAYLLGDLQWSNEKIASGDWIDYLTSPG